MLSALYSIITEKQEDDEIVLQILYAFFHLLQATEPRFALLQSTQLVVYLLDLLLDKNAAVRRTRTCAQRPPCGATPAARASRQATCRRAA